MPRQPTITFEDVVAIADRLIAGGVKPTPRLILDEHGSGGLGTIYQLFKRWQARQELHIDGGLSLPPGLQKTILDFMAQEIAGARQELETNLAESEHRAADLARENERQAGVAEEQSDQLAMLHEKAALLEAHVEKLGHDLDEARDDARRERSAAEYTRTELAKAELRLEGMPRLEGDLSALRGDYEVEHGKRIAAEQAVAVVAAQKESLAGRCDEDKARANELSAQLRNLHDLHAEAMAQLTALRMSAELTNTRLAAADRELMMRGKRTWIRNGANGRH